MWNREKIDALIVDVFTAVFAVLGVVVLVYATAVVMGY
jgi:hypothetical protein